MSWTATFWYDDIAEVDHAAEGDTRLLAYLAAKPRMQAFLSALLAPVDSLEGLAIDVLVGCSIWTAVGVQLDTLGRIVRQLRGELTDAEYRLAILGRIFVNRGDGTLPQFAELLELLEVPTVTTYEFWPACAEVNAAGVVHPTVVGDLVFDLKGGGVALRFVRSTYPEGEVFSTASTPGADEADANRGFSNPAGTSGGRLSYVRWS